MKKNYIIGIIVFLSFFTIASVFMYVRSLRENLSLRGKVAQTDAQMKTLETTKATLESDLSTERERADDATQKAQTFKRILKASAKRIHDLNVASIEQSLNVEQLSTEVSLLQQETSSLRTEHAALKQEMEQTTQENESMKVKLGSVVELKKAIRELRIEARHVAMELRAKIRSQQLLQGNRGFLVKDGKNLNPSHVRIEVNPTPES